MTKPVITARGALLLRRAELLEEQARIDRQLAEIESSPDRGDEYSTFNLPPDAKNVDAFNRACRSGRVAGATKRGRAWVCSPLAWDAREAAPSPRVAKRKSTRANDDGIDDDILAELGARRAS
jgi:hypothetical protein